MELARGVTGALGLGHGVNREVTRAKAWSPVRFGGSVVFFFFLSQDIEDRGWEEGHQHSFSVPFP